MKEWKEIIEKQNEGTTFSIYIDEHTLKRYYGKIREFYEYLFEQSKGEAFYILLGE